MPNELHWDSVTGTGETWDAYRFRKNGNVLLSNGASDEEWGESSGNNARDYFVPLTEVGSIGHYVGDFDPNNNVATEKYKVKYAKRAGANPADTDKVRARGTIDWDGVNHEEIFNATEVKQDIIDTVVDTIAVDVAGIDGESMRGTDWAALSSDLNFHMSTLATHNAGMENLVNARHATTNGKVDTVQSDVTDIKVVINTLDGLVEDISGDRFTEKALEQAPTAEMDATELANAMKAITGITEGGTWTWEKIMKIATAWVAGNWRVKPSNSDVQELMDAENGTTVILEQALTRFPGSGLNYRTIVVKI